MKPWQIIALISGSIISIVMALAATSYSATLGSAKPAFLWLPISNSMIFAVLALAFDLGMIASISGAAYWWSRNRIAAIASIILFVIASAFSIHAVRGYIATNLTDTAAPATRDADVYTSLKLELTQAQSHLGQLQTRYVTASRREKRRLTQTMDQLTRKIDDTRTRLAHTDVSTHASPLIGFEWALAVVLWFFNATCWTAWFGFSVPPPRSTKIQERDTVSEWLGQYDLSSAQHCTKLFEAYLSWCDQAGHTSLAQYSFYARLVELGARKFRDGRNGPTMYEMPLSNGQAS